MKSKFRGFVKELNQWVVGDLLSNNGQPIIVKQVKRNYISTTDVGQGKHWAIETPAYFVVPESVGQFTGLKDKNGVDIYEGDVIDFDTHTGIIRGIVEYNEKVCSFCLKSISKYENQQGQYYFVEQKTYEIIGNIYQHPELNK